MRAAVHDTYNEADGVPVWHIHWEARKHESIVVGHYWYGSLLAKYKTLTDECRNADIWGAGQAIYQVSKIVDGLNAAFEDRQHVLYVNASYKGDDPIGDLMHDFLCSDPDEMLTPILAEKARFLKTDPKGVDIMCKAMDELREQSIKRGEEAALLMSIKNIMEGLKYTAQQAMDLLKIPASEQPKYLAKL